VTVAHLWAVTSDASAGLSDTPAVDVFDNTITPVLTVSNAAQAVAFYERAFAAVEIYRNTYPDGRIVAELAVGAARFRVADEAPDAFNLSPDGLNGTTVRLNLLVADPDALSRRAIANGAVEVAPVADQSYGLRQGRLADPFGHHWLIGRPLEGDAGAELPLISSATRPRISGSSVSVDRRFPQCGEVNANVAEDLVIRPGTSWIGNPAVRHRAARSMTVSANTCVSPPGRRRRCRPIGPVFRCNEVVRDGNEMRSAPLWG
jgi:PhnB protein